MKLIAKDSVDTYEHLPMPAVTIAKENRHYLDDDVLVEAIETWTIDGILIYSTNATITEQIAELESFYANARLDSIELKSDGNTTLDSLTAQALKGIVVESLTFPEGNGPEWATRRKYRIVVSGKYVPTVILTSGEVNYTIIYDTPQSGQLRRTVSGTVKDVAGTATAKYNTLKTTWDSWAPAPFIGANRGTDTNNANKDDTVCTFTLEDTVYWIAFPTGITNGEINTEIDTDSMGVAWCNVTGWFEGSDADCTTAIADIAPAGYTVLTDSTTRNDHTNRTSFTRRYILTAEGEVSSSETLTIKEQLYEFVHKRVLGGGVPIRQDTSKGPFRYTQTGAIRSKDVYPTPPGYNWNVSGLLSEQVTRIAPEFEVGAGNFIYGLQYTYIFEFAITQGWSS
ncbi:MAG: hypothetical protein FVQ80_11495 [Planctomycetes bacterium]|nr:hypothetical protein [Planctomycetota bacterium]